jgi:hypothetical protein
MKTNARLHVCIKSSLNYVRGESPFNLLVILFKTKWLNNITYGFTMLGSILYQALGGRLVSLAWFPFALFYLYS